MVIIQKYGGTSVGDLEKITTVAKHIEKCLGDGKGSKKIIAVVSAMGKQTDVLIEQANKLAKKPNERELDQLLSIGEIQSAALLAIKLNELGIKARSFTGWQIGLETDQAYGNASILGLKNKNTVNKLLKEFDALVVTGFQGLIRGQLELVTVGRGGSDAIAVALAVELNATCEIYTDVDGVYAVDPRVVKNAKKFKIITPDQMINMYHAGAGVMMGRSVEIAQRFGKPIKVMLSPSFGESDGGTTIKTPSSGNIESPIYSELIGIGIRKVGIVNITDIPNMPGTANELFKSIEVNVEEVVQPLTLPEKLATITIMLKRENVSIVAISLEKLQQNDKMSGVKIFQYPDLVSLTLIDPNMTDTPRYSQRITYALSKQGINIETIFSAGDKIGVVVKEAVYQNAAQILSEEFGLTN